MEFKTIIGKNVLLEQLRENKARYVETRKALIEAYRKKSEEFQNDFAEYTKKVYEVRLTEDDARPYPPTIPEDRTETYEMYIAMVEWHCGDTLEIDSANFRSLFMDKWDFIREHIRAIKVWSDTDASLAAALTAYGD